MKDNIILSKSKAFAVRIVRLCRYLREEKKEFVLSQQLLRSGTSIGANVHEGKYAQSVDDFISKNSIALKEAAETEYWLELLDETDYLAKAEYDSISGDCSELMRLLTSIVKTTKENKNNC